MKLFKSLTKLLILLFSITVFAQSKVTGTVVDEKGIPINTATIVLKNSNGKLGEITDEEGKFTITTTAGTYNIEISYLGFQLYKSTIDITDNETKNIGTITLLEGTEQLQGVEILGRVRKDYNSDYSFSATKTSIKNRELPQSVATVTKELIDDRVAFQLPEAVRTVSNVALTGLYNHYNIRGITQADDGQMLNGMRTRQYYFLQPITSHLERVEVIKGPSSVTFSSADPGGTVNMVTKKPLTEKRNSVSLTAGSFGTLRATADFTGPLNESKTLLYRFNAAFQEADSFRDVVNNNAILLAPSISFVPNENTSLNVEMIYNDAEGNLDRGQPIFGAINGEFDLNSTPITRNVGASNDHYKNKEVILMANFTQRFTKSFAFNAQYMKQTWDEDLAEHRVDGTAVDIDGNVIPTLARLRYDRRQQFWETDNFSAFFTYDIEKGNITNKFLVGYDATRWERQIGAGFLRARRYLTVNGGQANYDPSNPGNFQQMTVDGVTMPVPAVPHFNLEDPFNGARNTDNYNLATLSIPANLNTSNGIYIQNQFKIGKLSALVNLRYEWFKDIFDYKSNDEQEFTTSAFVPRLGLTYEVNDNISAYATYLGGFQPHTNTVSLSPTAEGFFWAASPGRYDPLESSLVEVGAKGEFLNGRIFANLAIFNITQKNILLGDTYDLDTLTTRGEQRSRGFEFDISGYVSNNFQLMASYGFNDATIEEDAIEEFIGERIGGAPKHNANFWGRYNFNSTSTFRGLGVGLGAQYVDERFTWYNPTYSTDRVLLPDYTVFEGAVYYKPSGINMQLTLKVNNLFNKTYWLGGLNPSRLGPGAPRNVLLNATYNF
ncbi:TonB-dependent siderophore receptor [Winogradskyella sp. PC-19]|uniref:TonB-dependent siderophore receptor n=1 Tax=unclassified Winogradskyella TaxID=2615021 RepID=UPI000B3C6C62|nr:MULTISPECIES: TonB-dependent siderophore receptor [unclassified Winogradskyella]ARV08783.1 TonB-dependent siderophore receptor [Winogradskyella sp. PC-19]